MPPPDQMRAYANARKFIDTQMEPPDLVAIMTFQGGAVRVKQDFTDDRAAAAGSRFDADLRRRSGRRRDSRQPGRRHGLRPGRRRVQHLQHRSPAVGAADGGHDAAAAARAEVAGLLRERPAAERHRQPGAAARHDQRGDPLERRDPPDRRARPGGAAAARRRDAAVAGRHRHVLRAAGAGRDDELPAIAGHALRAGARTPAARRCSTTTTCRSASRRRPSRSTSYYIIGYYSAQHRRRRPVPPRPGLR